MPAEEMEEDSEKSSRSIELRRRKVRKRDAKSGKRVQNERIINASERTYAAE